MKPPGPLHGVETINAVESDGSVESVDTVDARVLPGREAPADLRAHWVVADRYEILGLLGSGGMGTVYRARDRELDELVALKMLKKQIAASPGILERFRQEVKLARRVTHRNVARTFDIGEHAGGKFLTMELVDGEMLGAMLARRGRLRVDEVTRIGKELCAGLSAAHAAGVLHRDLKPANVVVARDGRVVITDFGIARALAAGESTQTSGGVVGTPAYMAPEQLDGSTALDARTDVYALGAMLFELLGGEVPWAKATPVQAALARLNEPPPDLRQLRPSVSEGAARLIARCMATRREDRYASAAEVGGALGDLEGIDESSPSLFPAASRPSVRALARIKVAVVPIVVEGDPSHEYLGSGLTDDLVDVLGSVPGLDVRAPYRLHFGSGARAPEGVDSVITGTLRAEGEQVVVVLRLSTVEDGFELWQGRFERSTSELVAVADAAVSAIAEALTTKALAPPRPMPTNPQAYDLFLRGRHAFLRGWYDAHGESLRHLAEAHMLSPGDATIAATYARALARAYGTDSSRDDAARLAKEMAEKALALDPRRADARLALASVHLYRGELVGAATELKRATAIAPDDPDVLEMLGRIRAEVGPLETAVEHLSAALVREPSFREARYTLARAWALLGDRERCKSTLGPAPTDAAERVPWVLNGARLALWWSDRRPQLSLAASVASLGPEVRARRVAGAMLAIAERGALTDGDRELIARAFPSGAATAQRLASFHAQLRAEILLACAETDAALEAIREADANGLVDLTWLERCPLLEALRGSRELEAVRRGTALRAARVIDVLAPK